MDRAVEKGTALITGATSAIGAEYAERLARRGFDLVLAGRDARCLDELAARIEAKTLSLVETVTVDLTRAAGLRRLEDILRTDTSICVLVNGAGMRPGVPAFECGIETLQRVIELNVLVLTRLCHAAACGFADRGEGTIVNVGSITALAPELRHPVYGATEAYVLAFSRALRRELEGTGVHVQVVLPGEPRESPQALVDAALAGLDRRQPVIIPALSDMDDWYALEAARLALQPNLSRAHPAERYRAVAAAAASTASIKARRP